MAGENRRLDLKYLYGINRAVSHGLMKPNEPSHAENARTVDLGALQTRAGSTLLGNDISAQQNYGLFLFNNTMSENAGLFRVTQVGGFVHIYTLNGVSNVWSKLSDPNAQNLSAAYMHVAVADNKAYMVNGYDDNRVLNPDGSVTTSASTTSNFYGSPKAFAVTFHKDRLYLADYYVSGNRYRNYIMQSSLPLGIVGLVDGDHDAGVTTINVTDTKYIRSTDSIDVYRGGTKIETLSVTAKGESTITTVATANALLSSDELWVANTYNGEKVYRWADYRLSGVEEKMYDTFKVGGDDTGGSDDSITVLTTMRDNMIAMTANNIYMWNGYQMKSLDMGIGCPSRNGFVKALGSVYFIHDTGIYAMSGGIPELLSVKFAPYLKGATTAGLQGAIAGFKGDSVFFYIGNVTLYNSDGSVDKTLTGVTLEYNIIYQQGFVHTGVVIEGMSRYDYGTPRQLAFLNGTNKYVMTYLTGTQDGSSNIPFRVDLGPFQMAPNPENPVSLNYLMVDVERGSDVACFYSFDGEKWREVPTRLHKGVNFIRVVENGVGNYVPKGHKLSLSFRNMSRKTTRIAQVSVMYAVSAETPDDDNDN